MKNIIYTFVLFLLLLTTKGHAQVLKNNDLPLFISSVSIESSSNVLFFAQKGTKHVVAFDIATQKSIATWPFSQAPTGLAIQNGKLYVTTSYDKGMVYKIDIQSSAIEDSLATGMGACSPYVDTAGGALLV
ncbi:hypothetical protein OAT16_10610, partial [Prolixibacteraceae bacterium]|nr:hypothetical protein [Prolixibacteraceae bacterium]